MTIYKFIVLKRVLLIAFLIFVSAAQASLPLTTQIRTELGEELYPLDTVLTGYKRSASEAPKFAVADFRINKDNLHFRSKAIAEVLRYHLQYVPGVRLYMPAAYNTHDDAQLLRNASGSHALMTSRSAFKNLNATLGVETILTGKLDTNGEQQILIAELVDAISGKIIVKREWKISDKDLAATLISLSEWVYESLGVELNGVEQAYLKNNKVLDQAALEVFISRFEELSNLKGPVKRELINKFQEDYPHLVVLSVYALHQRTYAMNLDQAYENLELYKRLQSQNKGNAGVVLESFRMMEMGALPKHEVASGLNAMKNLVVANSVDPTIFINYAEGLVKVGNSLEGIVILLEGVERWPQNYRVWWSLGWALNQHSWQVRGNSKWRDVPERAKEKFKLLSYLADRAIDEALGFNARNGILWSQKIRTMGSLKGYSPELMKAFDKAVELVPVQQQIYDAAWNYAADKWGGNASSRRHIADLAVKYNPDAAWPIVMQNYIKLNDAVDPMSLIDDQAQMQDVEKSFNEIKEMLKEIVGEFEIWKLIALAVFIVLVLWTVYGLGKQSAENEALRRERER